MLALLPLISCAHALRHRGGATRVDDPSDGSGQRRALRTAAGNSQTQKTRSRTNVSFSHPASESGPHGHALYGDCNSQDTALYLLLTL